MAEKGYGVRKMGEIDFEKMSEQEAKNYFDKNYNIGYYDENLPKPSNELIFKHYVSSSLIYAFAAMLFLFNPFYINTFGKMPVKIPIIIIFLCYLVIAPIIYFIFKPKTIYVSHSIEVMNYILKLIKRENLKKNPTAAEFLEWLTPTYKQKQSIILYFLKFFFAPQLIIWTIGHYTSFAKEIKNFIIFNSAVKTQGITSSLIFATPELLVRYRNIIYLILFNLLYFFDCFFFAIGYCTEMTFLRNRIRTVESSAAGLLFCLMCYPPFNGATAKFLQWNHSEIAMNVSSNPLSIANWIVYIIGLFLIFIYVSASVALFTKASNLTNRGTVKIFPYNIIRHPAYATKIAVWWLGSISAIIFMYKAGNYTLIPLYMLAALCWSFIYYMRAITEERHLSLDPDYRAYCKKVKYRFIPFVW